MAKCSLGDVVIYETDVSTLKPGQWVGDKAIAYLFESFAIASEAAQTQQVVLLEPSTTFMAAMVGDADMLKEMLSQPRQKGAKSLADALAAADVVVIPVSDNTDAEEAGGGGHWSLLVFRRGGFDGSEPSRCFQHYDSCGHANSPHAIKIMKVMCKLLMPEGVPRTMQLVKMNTPQQANGFDCGVYCLAIAEAVVATMAADAKMKPDEALASALEALTPDAINEKRKGWFELMSSKLA